jgi:hypothetical protein
MMNQTNFPLLGVRMPISHTDCHPKWSPDTNLLHQAEQQITQEMTAN